MRYWPLREPSRARVPPLREVQGDPCATVQAARRLEAYCSHSDCSSLFDGPSNSPGRSEGPRAVLSPAASVQQSVRGLRVFAARLGDACKRRARAGVRFGLGEVSDRDHAH